MVMLSEPIRVERGVLDAGVCDAVYAELQVVCRRVLRVRELASRGGVEESAPLLFRAVGDLLGKALEALGTVPDVPAGVSEVGGAVVFRVGGLSVCPAARRVVFAGREVRVVGKEFDLLVRLARDPVVVVSKRDLLRDVWSLPDGVHSRTVDTHASRLRRCLVQAGAVSGSWVVNHWGVGYSLTSPAS